MQIERVEWEVEGKRHMSIGAVISSSKHGVVLSSDLTKTESGYETSDTTFIVSDSIVSRRTLQWDGFFKKDKITVIDTITQADVSEVVSSKEVVVAPVEEKVTPKKTAKKSKVEVTKVTEPVKSSARKGRKYAGPFAGKFDNAAFKADIPNMTIAGLAKKYNMSWTTAQAVVKYFKKKPLKKAVTVDENTFLSLYDKYTYNEIAERLGISKNTVSGLVVKLHKAGKLTHKIARG